MADSPASPQTQTPPPDPDPEADFWRKHKENTVGILNEWWADKQKDTTKPDPKTDPKADDKPEPGTSRMKDGKRVTLPGLIADVVFGPNKE